MKEIHIPTPGISRHEDSRRPHVIRGRPIVDRMGEIIGWALKDGSLDYVSHGKEDIWIEIKPKKSPKAP